ncbi:MAG: peptidylprolyl isomerase [Alphaproteobacteria bacterium]
MAFYSLALSQLDSPPASFYVGEGKEAETSTTAPPPAKSLTLYRKDRKPLKEATIAAIVNGTPISVKDLKNKMKLALKIPFESLPASEQQTIRQTILNILIEELIKIQTTEKLGLKVDSQEIDSALQNLEKQNGMPKGKLRQDLKAKGINESALTNSIKAELLWRQYISAWAGNSLELGQKELKEIMNISGDTTQYHLAEIEIYTKEGESEETTVAAMNKILQALKAKHPFTMLAHTYSHAPSSARGGDIGWTNQEILDEDLVTVLEKLQPGQITMPFKTESGYKILLLIDKKDTRASQPTLTARQIEIKVEEELEKSEKDLEAKIEQLNKLVESVTSCTEFDQLADQIPSSQIHVYKTVRLNDLSSDLQNVLKYLETGTPSKGIFNPANNTIAFFMVCERTETPLEKTNAIEGVANQISNQRFMSISEQKLKEAKRVASIEIRL